MAKEDEIRLIAFNIWEQEGCTNGKDCEHWFRAEAIWDDLQKPHGENTIKKSESPISRVIIPPARKNIKNIREQRKKK